jgi:hypothetical protein
MDKHASGASFPIEPKLSFLLAIKWMRSFRFNSFLYSSYRLKDCMIL